MIGPPLEIEGPSPSPSGWERPVDFTGEELDMTREIADEWLEIVERFKASS
jgi:hypothetical protein